MIQSEMILHLIEVISPHAKDYVNEALNNNKVEIFYSIQSEQNNGVFLIVKNDDCSIFYASFSNEPNEQILHIIKDKTSKYIKESCFKEICFNIYGKNETIISLAKELGFHTDMEGFHLQYMGKDLPKLHDSKLISKDYDSYMLDEFIDLFDSAYYQLDKDNGWKTNSHATYKKQFESRLNELYKLGQVCSFWLEDELLGVYIFEGNYITDLVIKPLFQNKGYGSYILEHCIRNMKINKSTENIRLRVTKSNIGAKKLYERNKFIEIACFAEHTYQ